MNQSAGVVDPGGLFCADADSHEARAMRARMVNIIPTANHHAYGLWESSLSSRGKRVEDPLTNVEIAYIMEEINSVYKRKVVAP